MQIYSDFSYQTLNRSSERTTTLRVLGCYLLNVDAVMLDGWMFGMVVRWGQCAIFPSSPSSAAVSYMLLLDV